MSARVVRFVPALLLGLLTMVYMPGQAWANQSPWVPPSAVEGDSAVVGTVLEGAAVAAGGGYGVTKGDGAATYDCVWNYVDSEIVADGVRVLGRWEGDKCGSRASSPPSTGLSRKGRCGNEAGTWSGWTAGNGYAVSGASGAGGWWYTFKSAAGCAETYPLRKIIQGSVVGSGSVDGSGIGAACYTGEAPSYCVGWVVVTLGVPTTVEVTCVSGSGMVSVVSSTAAAGVQATCAAGSYPVGVSVRRGSTVLGSYEIPGYATRPELAAVCASGGCRPMVSLGGYTCDPTMAVGLGDPDWCDRLRGGQVPKTGSPACRWTEPTTLAYIDLPMADCASWLEGVAGPPVPDPEEPDLGIITEWMQRIKSAIDKVKSAVDGAKNGIVDAVSDAANRIIAAIGPGDPGGTGNCPAGGCPSGNPAGPGHGEGPGVGQGDEVGGVQDKFAPLTDWWMEFAHAWEVRPSGDCRGPAMPLPAPMGTIYPLNACEDPMRTIAGLAKLVGTVVLVVGAVLLVVRTQAAAWSFNTDVGKGGES